MSDPAPTEPFGGTVPNLLVQHPPLPGWLATRLLRSNEKVTWVRGPRWNPASERYLTHPALFLAAVGVVVSWLIVGSWSDTMVLPVLGAGFLALASIIVLALASGYFTRLVVTNFRIVILQGYEVCRSWSIDRLPRSLLRYRTPGGREESPTIDLAALQTMLGGSSGQFVEAKTIGEFSKHLDRIKPREDDRS
jgi:hypothetical protein